jgi:hypothetical protein
MSRAFILSCVFLTVALFGGEPAKLTSSRVAKGPSLDGKADDEAWKSAKAAELEAIGVMERSKGTSTKVWMRSVHTDTHIYFLVIWDDATEDVSHKTWTWNAATKTYEEGKDREDMFALAFEHTGPFTGDMLSGEESVWDIWHWKAFRTNPHGYAMDKTHRHTLEKPAGKANSHQAKNGKAIWIGRPEDAGDTVEKKQPAPTENKGEKVPQFVAGEPSGSASDVRAKGAWAEKKWTLELERKLNTGNSDDTAFDPAKIYKMALSAFDHTGDMDKATGVIELNFAK